MYGIGTSALLAAIALPSASTLLQQYQLFATANELAGEIGRARIQAVAQNRFVRVQLDGVIFCRQTAAAASGPWSPTSCEQASETIRLPGSMVAAVSTAPPTFNRNGTAETSSLIRLVNPLGEKSLLVNILGGVTIQ